MELEFPQILISNMIPQSKPGLEKFKQFRLYEIQLTSSKIYAIQRQLILCSYLMERIILHVLNRTYSVRQWCPEAISTPLSMVQISLLMHNPCNDPIYLSKIHLKQHIVITGIDVGL